MNRFQHLHAQVAQLLPPNTDTATRYLAQCEMVLVDKPDCPSLHRAILAGARLGLEPGLHLVFVERKGVWAALPNWQGRLTLATRSGLVDKVECNVVRDGDAFELDLANPAGLRHPVAIGGGKEGRLVGVWARFTLPGGSQVVEWCSPDDIARARAASPGAAYDSSPWKKHEAEMWRKTCIAKGLKRVPFSTANNRIQRLLMDNAWDVDDTTMADKQPAAPTMKAAPTSQPIQLPEQPKRSAAGTTAPLPDPKHPTQEEADLIARAQAATTAAQLREIIMKVDKTRRVAGYGCFDYIAKRGAQLAADEIRKEMIACAEGEQAKLILVRAKATPSMAGNAELMAMLTDRLENLLELERHLAAEDTF